MNKNISLVFVGIISILMLAGSASAWGFQKQNCDKSYVDDISYLSDQAKGLDTSKLGYGGLNIQVTDCNKIHTYKLNNRFNNQLTISCTSGEIKEIRKDVEAGNMNKVKNTLFWKLPLRDKIKLARLR